MQLIITFIFYFFYAINSFSQENDMPIGCDFGDDREVDSIYKKTSDGNRPVVFINNQKMGENDSTRFQYSIMLEDLEQHNLKIEVKDSIYGALFAIKKVEFIYMDTTLNEIVSRRIADTDSIKRNSVIDEFMLKNGNYLILSHIMVKSPYNERTIPIRPVFIRVIRCNEIIE